MELIPILNTDVLDYFEKKLKGEEIDKQTNKKFRLFIQNYSDKVAEWYNDILFDSSNYDGETPNLDKLIDKTYKK